MKLRANGPAVDTIIDDGVAAADAAVRARAVEGRQCGGVKGGNRLTPDAHGCIRQRTQGPNPVSDVAVTAVLLAKPLK